MDKSQPISTRQPLLMICETCTIDDNNDLVTESKRLFNMYAKKDTDWLAKHGWWAAQSGKSILTYKATPADISEITLSQADGI